MTTSRSPERRSAFLLACITALLAIALAMWFIGTVRAEPVAGMSLAGRFSPYLTANKCRSAAASATPSSSTGIKWP
jgi:hypothetical protein